MSSKKPTYDQSTTLKDFSFRYQLFDQTRVEVYYRGKYTQTIDERDVQLFKLHIINHYEKVL